ncbi:unnamed protein product [Cyprideis torosa]|uniref:Uncharacterized protein n=1 Tax=Cyprideis torosa TaxID=163714 RepID=A0A7R8WQJ4_9CRUS|nr:unnamed protein product [Cyprideis torosa]CAG0903096.1 unnamed protein product [Cyprideis torosa]
MMDTKMEIDESNRGMPLSERPRNLKEEATQTMDESEAMAHAPERKLYTVCPSSNSRRRYSSAASFVFSELQGFIRFRSNTSEFRAKAKKRHPFVALGDIDKGSRPPRQPYRTGPEPGFEPADGKCRTYL